ncbi:hypothetical protein [Halohasta litorea]|uniref:Profilin fold domain-containing protein n=1 Tax=Halohasta litorea TaxID=869891 RepID=A0ABD6D824_9EURY|nr:hypothetical protein [Halohasta litorea]
MDDGLDVETASTDELRAQREAILADVRSHAGEIARELALLEGGDYGRRSFTGDHGEWTVKYEAGRLEFLLFESKSGAETYVISTKQPPEPKALRDAMQDYDAFVEAYNDFVDTREDVLDDVDPAFPDVRSTETVVADRDRIVAAIHEVATEIAQQCYRYEGTDYGTFSTTVDGTRWELKWEEGQVSYLRVGGEGGVYLLSQYSPPSAPDVRALADDVEPFVEAFNAFVDDLEVDLGGVSFTDA